MYKAYHSLFIVFLFLLYPFSINAAEESESGSPLLRLWYPEPASQWVEALPVGNGSLGAMVFGGVKKERIQFNEDTIWTGIPHDYSNPFAYEHLPQIRRLLLEGKQKRIICLDTKRGQKIWLDGKLDK
jgi:alpha-L-fucosidase 2